MLGRMFSISQASLLVLLPFALMAGDRRAPEKAGRSRTPPAAGLREGR
jgi:hypothetical protein